jgi:hypothetical protein
VLSDTDSEPESFTSDEDSSLSTPGISEEGRKATRPDFDPPASAMTAHITTFAHDKTSTNADGQPLQPPGQKHMKVTQSSSIALNASEIHNEELAMADDELGGELCPVQEATLASVINAETFPMSIVEQTEQQVPPGKSAADIRVVNGTAGIIGEGIADDKSSIRPIDLTASPEPGDSRVAEVEKSKDPVLVCQTDAGISRCLDSPDDPRKSTDPVGEARNGRKRTSSEVSDPVAADRTDAEYRLKRVRQSPDILYPRSSRLIS